MDYDNEAVDWEDDEIEEIQPPQTSSNFQKDDPDPSQDDIEDTVSLGEEEDSTFYPYQPATTPYQLNGAQEDSRIPPSRSPSPRRPRRDSPGASRRRSPNPTSATDRSRAPYAHSSTRTRRPADRNSSNPSPTRSNILARPLHALPAKPQVARPGTPPAPIYAVTSMIGDSPRQNRDGKRSNGASVAQNSPPTDPRPPRGSRRASSIDDDHRYRDPETVRDHPDSIVSPPHEPFRRTVPSATSSSRHTRRPSPGPLPPPPYVAPTLSAEDRHYEPARDAHSRHAAPTHSRPLGRPSSPPPPRRRSRSGSPPGDRFFAPRDADFGQARKSSGPERQNDPDLPRSNQPNTGRAWEASYYTPAYGPSGQPRRRQDEDSHRSTQDDRIPTGSNRHRDESRPQADAASYPPPRRRSPSPYRQPPRADHDRHSPPPSNYRRPNEPSSFDRDGNGAVRLDRPPLGPNGPSAHDDRYYRPRSPSPPLRPRQDVNRRPVHDDDLDRGPNQPPRRPRPPPQTDSYGGDSRGPPPARARDRDPLPHIASQPVTDRVREGGQAPAPRNDRRLSAEDRPRERERERGRSLEREREVDRNPRGYPPRGDGDSLAPPPRRRSPGPPPPVSGQQPQRSSGGAPPRYVADGQDAPSPAPPRGPARTAVSPHRGLPENVPRGPAAGAPPVGPRARAPISGGGASSRPPPDAPVSRPEDKPKPQPPTQPAGWGGGGGNDGGRRADEESRRPARRGARHTSAANNVPLGQRRPNNQPPAGQQQPLPSQSQSQESVATNDSRQARSNADPEMMRPASPPPSVPSSVNSSQEVLPPPRAPSPPRAANDTVRNAYQKIRRIRSEKADKMDERLPPSRQDRERDREWEQDRRDAAPPRSRDLNESSHRSSTLDRSPEPYSRNDHRPPPPLSDNAYMEGMSRRQPPPLAAPPRDSYYSMSASTSSQSQSQPQSQSQSGPSRRGAGDLDGRNDSGRYAPPERERERERIDREREQERERERLRERERDRDRERELRDRDREHPGRRDRPNGVLPPPPPPGRYPNGVQQPPPQHDFYPPHPSSHPPPLLDRFSDRVQVNDRERERERDSRSGPPSRTHSEASPTSPRLPPLVGDRYLPDKNSGYRRGGRAGSPPPPAGASREREREEGPPSLVARIFPRVDLVGVGALPRDGHPSADWERERQRDERDRGPRDVRDRERERERVGDYDHDYAYDRDPDREGYTRDTHRFDRDGGSSRPPGPNNNPSSSSSTIVTEHYRRDEMEVELVIHPPSRAVTQGMDVDRHYKQYPNLPFHHSLPPRPQSTGASLLNRIGNGNGNGGSRNGDGDVNGDVADGLDPSGDVGMVVDRHQVSPSASVSHDRVMPERSVVAEDGYGGGGGGVMLQDRVVPSKRDRERDDVMAGPGSGRVGERYEPDDGRRGDMPKRPRRAGRRTGGGGGGGGRRRGERGSVGV